MSTTMTETLSAGVVPSNARWLNILPVVFIMYTIAYFDRANIGIALPFIRKDLGLDSVEAGFVGSVFVWGYTATQIFAGWLALRLGSRSVIGWALVLWGLASVATAFVASFHQLIAARFLLGLFEGPVFASTAIFLSEWFTRPERGRAFGFWNLSSPVGAFLAGPISGYLLAHYDWRMMMIVEGLPALVWAALWWWRIPRSLDGARWLDPAERAGMRGALAAEQEALKADNAAPWWTVLAEPAVWFTLAGFTLINLLISGYTLWLPSLLRALGIERIETVGWLSGAPFLFGVLGIYLIARHSDHHGQERRWHSAVPAFLTGLLLVVDMVLPSRFLMLQVALLILCGFPMKAFLPLVFTNLTEILPRQKAVPAVVFVNTTGNLLAGSLGPIMIGYLHEVTSSYSLAFAILGVSGMLSGVLFAFIAWPRTAASPT